MKNNTSFVKNLSKIMKDNNLAYIEYSEDDFSVKLATEVPSNNKTSTNIDSSDVEVSNLKEIKCPLVGHFYVAKTPGDEPFVKVGDQVSVGDVIGIVQAMKVSNEVVATESGVVVEICVENDEFVDFDRVLMKLE